MEIESVPVGMAPTFCNRCGDAVVGEGCDPWDELDELDALSDRLRLKRYDLKRNINRFHSPIAPTFCNHCRDAVENECDPWDELAELDALSERLRLKRYNLKGKINRFQSPIIRQLPPDVTLTIFKFCLPYLTSLTGDNHLSSYTEEDLSIPLSLGAICSYWRDIAWSTPSLWSSLVVRFRRKHDAHIITSIAQEWLARSGQLPLSIRIFSLDYHEAISALAFIINQYSTLWSDLDLDIPVFYYRRFHATDNHAPILKSIRLRNSDFGMMMMHMNFQLTCPRLERACLTYLPMYGINIQWDNLTHLTLHSMSIVDSFAILRKTPRLVFCKATGFSGSHYIVSRIGEPVLTSMRSLQLLSPSFTKSFFNNLIAPHLEEFSLSRYHYLSTIDSEMLEVITSFLRRSTCSLRSFSMIFSHIFPPYIASFTSLLQSMLSLNTLSIISTTTTWYSEITTPEDYDPQNIFQLVAKVLSSQSTSLQGFLPNLKVLEYTGRLDLRPKILDGLCCLLPPNNAVHGPLHLLRLDLHPATRIPITLISYFSCLVERGVAVNVLSKSEDILQSSIDYHRFREGSLCWDWADNLDSNIFS